MNATPGWKILWHKYEQYIEQPNLIKFTGPGLKIELKFTTSLWLDFCQMAQNIIEWWSFASPSKHTPLRSYKLSHVWSAKTLNTERQRKTFYMNTLVTIAENSAWNVQLKRYIPDHKSIISNAASAPITQYIQQTPSLSFLASLILIVSRCKASFEVSNSRSISVARFTWCLDSVFNCLAFYQINYE